MGLRRGGTPHAHASDGEDDMDVEMVVVPRTAPGLTERTLTPPHAARASPGAGSPSGRSADSELSGESWGLPVVERRPLECSRRSAGMCALAIALAVVPPLCAAFANAAVCETNAIYPPEATHRASLLPEERLQQIADEFRPLLVVHPEEPQFPVAVEQYLSIAELRYRGPGLGCHALADSEGRVVLEKGTITPEVLWQARAGRSNATYPCVSLRERENWDLFVDRDEALATQVDREKLASAPLYAYVKELIDRPGVYDIDYITFYAVNYAQRWHRFVMGAVSVPVALTLLFGGAACGLVIAIHICTGEPLKWGLRRLVRRWILLMALAGLGAAVIAPAVVHNPGEHMGDIEHVTVRADAAKGAVLGVYFGRHRYTDGEWRGAQSVQWAEGGRGKRAAAYVSRGDHGLYGDSAGSWRVFGLFRDEVARSAVDGLHWDVPRCSLLFDPMSDAERAARLSPWTMYSGMFGGELVASPSAQPWWYRNPQGSVTRAQALLCYAKRNGCLVRPVWDIRSGTLTSAEGGYADRFATEAILGTDREY
eukprot:TRINITY_DN17172_c0_g1_i1.p1 TRINITY_DN17172_c0_g1~~TRINITY_DN17172_c0_g1_i1.p1  ORF type:complete len:540 (+),score=151.76 TRINITY_DN17172_c0_g1_i1:92-1711(+)